MNKETVEIIFQIKINRQTGGFEFVRKNMSNIENTAFDMFIIAYAKTVMDSQRQNFGIRSTEDDKEAEDD